MIQSLSKSQCQSPIRVLQVVGGMNPGGIETWLLHVLQNINHDRVQMDFWVHMPQAGLYDPDIRALGSKIIISPPLRTPWAYITALRKMLKRQSYQVVHSHVHHFSGAVLKIAQTAGVPVRIAHSHLDSTALDSHSHWLRRSYLRLMQHWIQRYATAGISASGLAGSALFGQTWKTDPRWQILHCGVNLNLFQNPVDAQRLRAMLQIPPHANVIGHVGRFEAQKNHAFLVKVAAEVMQDQPNTYLLLIGQGSLLPDIQALVQTLGMGDRVIFAGIRRDIPQLMQGVMDVFVLPSRQEGLPLVLIEAQAAGLPCIVSDQVTPEVDILPNLIHRCSLDAAMSDWIKTIRVALRQRRQQRLELVLSSTFNIESSVQALEALYLAGLSYAV